MNANNTSNHEEPVISDIEAAIDALAARSALSREAFLAYVDQRLDERMAEDRPDCLLPDDIAEYQQLGELNPAAESHRRHCIICNQLVLAAVPDPQRILEVRNRARLAKQLPSEFMQHDRPKMWNNWRVPVAAMAMATIVVLGYVDRPVPPTAGQVARLIPNSSMTEHGLALNVQAQPGGAKPTSVTIPIQAIAPTSITVSEPMIQIAASAAVITKDPLKFDISQDKTMVADSSKESEVLVHEATQKTVFILANVSSQWETSTDERQALLARAIHASGATLLSNNPATGWIKLEFTGENYVANTSFNINHAVESANRYAEIIDSQWKNSDLLVTKPISLDNNVLLQISSPNMRIAQQSKMVKSALAR